MEQRSGLRPGCRLWHGLKGSLSPLLLVLVLLLLLPGLPMVGTCELRGQFNDQNDNLPPGGPLSSQAPFPEAPPSFRGRWGGGVGTRPRHLIVCLWRRLLASRHCTF